MDPRQHKRFLEYRELFEYFRPPGGVRLEREAWVALDEERAALEAEVRAGEASPEQRHRLRVVRRALLVD